MALLAQQCLQQLLQLAEAHVAVLSSPEAAQDPRAALVARLPGIAATADAVVQREVAAADAAQRRASAASAAASASQLRQPLPKPLKTPAAATLKQVCWAN